MVTAATRPSNPVRLGVLVDEGTGVHFLADTGSVYSLIPHQSSTAPSGTRLVTADKTPIPCWGSCTRTIHVGDLSFMWQFLLAAVAFPIVGGDFLRAFNMMVDLSNMRLVSSLSGASVPLSAPPSGGTFAAIGVQLALPE